LEPGKNKLKWGGKKTLRGKRGENVDSKEKERPTKNRELMNSKKRKGKSDAAKT